MKKKSLNKEQQQQNVCGLCQYSASYTGFIDYVGMAVNCWSLLVEFYDMLVLALSCVARYDRHGLQQSYTDPATTRRLPLQGLAFFTKINVRLGMKKAIRSSIFVRLKCTWCKSSRVCYLWSVTAFSRPYTFIYPISEAQRRRWNWQCLKHSAKEHKLFWRQRGGGGGVIHVSLQLRWTSGITNHCPLEAGGCLTEVTADRIDCTSMCLCFISCSDIS